LIDISNQMLEDSAFDMEGEIRREATEQKKQPPTHRQEVLARKSPASLGTVALHSRAARPNLNSIVRAVASIYGAVCGLLLSVIIRWGLALELSNEP
jgi:hypothetical protein